MSENTEVFAPQRNEKGHFLPGHGGARKRGTKNKITQRMLNEFVEYDEKGGTTPFKLWRDILDGKYQDRLDEMAPKDAWAIIMKASECMAKYIYDASYNTDEAENKLEMSLDQINALKAAFPHFKK